MYIVAKVYTGLTFKLSSLADNFLSNIRYDFSEGVLVYDILRSILSPYDSKLPDNFKLITGKDFEDIHLKRAPDFYCRIRNEILLFESKDFFMPGKEKLSYDFSTIERGLMEKDRLGKAITQLIKNIERCILLQLPLDNSYEPDAVSIYPVIIVHDALYSAPALNYWIHYRLMDELELLKSDERFKEFDFSKIVPLTIIEIDTLILYEIHFITKKIDLLTMIELYHCHVRFDLGEKLSPAYTEEHALKSALSFSEFARDYANDHEIQLNIGMLAEMLKKYR